MIEQELKKIRAQIFNLQKREQELISRLISINPTIHIGHEYNYRANGNYGKKLIPVKVIGRNKGRFITIGLKDSRRRDVPGPQLFKLLSS